LFGDRPSIRVDFFPARFELREIFALTVDRGARPIAYSAGALDSIYIVTRERRIFRAPRPEIVGKFIDDVRAGAARWRLHGGATQ
jgi:hypothetical protein